MIRIDCLKCRFLAVTWEPRYPYACTLLGFKSRSMPSVVAQNATGAPCVGYEAKGDKEPSQQSVIIDIQRRID